MNSNILQEENRLLKENEFQNPEDTYPTIYRVDRLEELEVLNEHFSVPYAERFEEGEFRKRIQFMYGGKLQKIIPEQMLMQY